MPHYKKIKLICVFLLVSFIVAGSVSAAKKKEQVKKEEGPVTITADYIHYDNATGDIFAEGNAVVLNNGQKISADRIDGNVKTGDIWTKTETYFEDPAVQNNFKGDYMVYNYNTKTGHVNNITGKSGTEFIKADNMEVLPDRAVGQNATMSRCNATKHAKCQHTTATRVDIWPNDRIIAYDAKVFVRGKQVYAQKRYVASLSKGESFFPRIGYDSDDGVYVAHTLAYPLGDKTVIGTNLYAGSKIGGRSSLWARQTETNFDFEYFYGYDKDDDSNWVKKENNIRARYKTKQLFRTPLKYQFWFERGLWRDKYKRSWHTEAGVYLSHDPIYLLGSESIYLTLGTGYRKLKESYQYIDQDEYRYDIGVGKVFSPKLRTYVLYSNVKNHVNVFDYNNIDVNKSINYMVHWTPDDKNSFSFWQQYDAENNRVYKNVITYARKLHCWEIILTYERERFRDRPYENDFRWEFHLAI